jgi:hypothetical protein
MAKAVFGIAKSETQAIMLADQLKAAGFSANDLSVLFPDKKGTKDFAHEQHTKAPEAAVAGQQAERSWAARWAGWWVSEHLQSRASDLSSRLAPLWQLWRERLAAPQPEV